MLATALLMSIENNDRKKPAPTTRKVRWIHRFYFRALIFCEENKGLIVIGTFYFNGMLIFKHFVQCSKPLVFKYQRDLSFFPENQCFKNKMTDYAHHWQYTLLKNLHDILCRPYISSMSTTKAWSSIINHSLLSGLLLTPLTWYLTNISESSQSRSVHMAQPEKGRIKYKNINKDKQKVKNV